MRLVVILVAVIMIAGPAFAGILVAPTGYGSVDTTIAIPADGSLSAFDYCGDGFVLFNGSSVVVAGMDGAVSNPLYTYGSSVYGSFVKVVGDKVYFGENSTGTIGSVSLDGTGGAILGNLAYNYDFAVNPQGQAYVITGSAWDDPNPVTKIWQFDAATGASDLVAGIAGPSGPIAFDGEGNLYYGSVSPVFGQIGGQSIYKWTASAVAGAMGEASLSTTDASVVVSDIDSPSAFTFGPAGELYYTSSVASPGAIWKVSNGTTSRFTTLDPALGTSWLTGLRYNPANGAFSAIGSWFGPDWAIATKIGTVAPSVPEPSAFVALASLVGLAAAARRRRS